MLRFTNESTKIYLARKGPISVFGRDVDTRESLTQDAAVALFDRVWTNTLQHEVEQAPQCSADTAKQKVPGNAKFRVREGAEHREFRVANSLFIAQLSSPDECNELWFIPSSSPDPRTLYVHFDNMPERDEFRILAERLGWEDQDLALELLRDFMKKHRKGRKSGA